MYELERPPHRVYAAPDEAQHERIRELHRYWLSKCRDGLLPSRSAIDPAEIRPLLPHLILAEFDAAPFAIRYRLVGTAIAKLHRDDFTGRTHDTVTSLAGAGLEESYRSVMERAAPVFGHSGLDAGDQTWIGFEYAILPLGGDGITVQKCLAMESGDEPDPAASRPNEDRIAAAPDLDC
jgi:hypothetical protein